MEYQCIEWSQLLEKKIKENEKRKTVSGFAGRALSGARRKTRRSLFVISYFGRIDRRGK